jgi:hypothetical protein
MYTRWVGSGLALVYSTWRTGIWGRSVASSFITKRRLVLFPYSTCHGQNSSVLRSRSGKYETKFAGYRRSQLGSPYRRSVMRSRID